MALEQRELAPGTKLVGTYKKTAYVCEVVATPEGETRYRLEDGKLFKSPSSAAKAVMNGISANGWRFWSLEGTQPEKAPGVAKVKATGQEHLDERKCFHCCVLPTRVLMRTE